MGCEYVRGWREGRGRLLIFSIMNIKMIVPLFDIKGVKKCVFFQELSLFCNLSLASAELLLVAQKLTKLASQ